MPAPARPWASSPSIRSCSPCSRPPGEMGADIAVAEGQSLGQPLSFGGLSGHHLPQGAYPPVPRRIVGRTTDLEGRNRLRAHPAGPRTAHPPRQGHVQHLLQPVPVPLRALMYLFAGGPGRSGPRGRARHGPWPLRGGKLTALPGVSRLNDAPLRQRSGPAPAASRRGRWCRPCCARAWPPVSCGPVPMRAWMMCSLLACTECNTRAQVDAMVESWEVCCENHFCRIRRRPPRSPVWPCLWTMTRPRRADAARSPAAQRARRACFPNGRGAHFTNLSAQLQCGCQFLSPWLLHHEVQPPVHGIRGLPAGLCPHASPAGPAFRQSWPRAPCNACMTPNSGCARSRA